MSGKRLCRHPSICSCVEKCQILYIHAFLACITDKKCFTANSLAASCPESDDIVRGIAIFRTRVTFNFYK